MINILAISGSLRENSSNSNILRMMASIAPPDVQIELYEGLGTLPHFDPGLDDENSSSTVQDFRQRLAQADGVIICTPEYAFGVPGSLKNALDWTVSSGEFTGKHVAVITASLGGDKAHAALLQIFTALSSKIAERSTLLIPFIRTKMNAQGEVSDPQTREALHQILTNLVSAIQTSKDVAVQL